MMCFFSSLTRAKTNEEEEEEEEEEPRVFFVSEFCALLSTILHFFPFFPFFRFFRFFRWRTDKRGFRWKIFHHNSPRSFKRTFTARIRHTQKNKACRSETSERRRTATWTTILARYARYQSPPKMWFLSWRRIIRKGKTRKWYARDVFFVFPQRLDLIIIALSNDVDDDESVCVFCARRRPRLFS